jgi:hypothetical protein
LIGFCFRAASTRPVAAHASATFGADGPGKLHLVRLMFWIWLAVIVSGVAFFTIVGLVHR